MAKPHILRAQLFLFARSSELDLWGDLSQAGAAVGDSEAGSRPNRVRASGQSRAAARSGGLGNTPPTVRLPAWDNTNTV